MSACRARQPRARPRRALSPTRAATLCVLLLLALADVSRAQIADPDFPTTDGVAFAQLLANDVLYLGGWFRRVVTARTGCSAHFEPGGETPSATWPYVDGSVLAVASDGSGGWYLGGEFTSVAGVPRDKLAHVRADGSLDGWAPTANWTVHEILARDSTVFVAGSFTLINGQPRSHLAALDAVDGELLPWNPGADGIVSAIVDDDSTLYLGGWFTRAGGELRNRLAAVDVSTGALRAWNPGADAAVLCMSRHDSRLFVGGNFTTLGGSPRAHLGALDLLTGQPLAWAPGPSTTVHALAFDDSMLFVGGSFLSIGGQPRVALAAFDLNSLELSAWNPDPNGYVAAFALRRDTLFAGGDFTTIGGHSRNHLAAFGMPGGGLLAWNPDLSDNVTRLGADESGLRVGGRFWSAGGLRRTGLAAIDAWSGAVLDWDPDTDGVVNALARSGNTLFVGGQFTRIGGEPRDNLAALDLASGTLLPWRPRVQPSVRAFALTPSSVIVGGANLVVDGEARGPIAAVDRASGSGLPFASGPEDGQVRALAVVDSVLYAGGWYFQPSPNPWYPYQTGYLARIGMASGQSSTYNLGVESYVRALARDRFGRLYAGGHFRNLSRPLLALDARTGDPLPWSAGELGLGVWALAQFEDVLYVGGNFDGGGFGSTLRAYALPTGAPLEWNPLPDGSVTSLAAGAPGVFASGTFGRIGQSHQPGLARLLDANAFTSPSVAVLQPSPGATLVAGTIASLRWSSGGGVPRIRSVDLRLSRSGLGGPWELLAAGVLDTGRYDWRVSGPAAANEAWLRVDARDFAGGIGSAYGDGPFSIADGSVPVLLELFRVEAVRGGILIEWKLSDPSVVATLAPQRGETSSGEFVPVDAAPTVENGVSRVLDPDAAPDRVWWYRLAGTRRDGGSFETAAIPSQGTGAAPAFALAPLAPNPTAGEATLSFAVPARTHVRLTLLDLQGREVARLADGERIAGLHTAALDARDLRPGLYFVRLQAPGVDLRRRLAIVR